MFLITFGILLFSTLLIDINGVYWYCETDTDCNSYVSDAFCSLENCICPAGKVLSSDLTRCIDESLYGEICEESVQCAHMLSGAYCNDDGKCDCINGHTYLRGRCRKLLNLYETCDEDTDCFFGYDRESVVCRENKCECADGYYQRTDNICRRISMIDEPCIVKADCQSDDNLECIQLTCTLAIATEDAATNTTNSYYKKRRLSRDIGIQTTIESSFNDSSSSTEQIPEIKQDSAVRLTGVLKKSSSTISNVKRVSIVDHDTNLRDEGDAKYGDRCTELNKPCPGLAYSTCIQGLCKCAAGYYHDRNLNNGICLAELGETAESKEFCGYLERYDETTKRCLCARNRFYGADLRSCWKEANNIGFSCTQQMQCSPFNGYCNSLRCDCPSYTIYDEKKELCVQQTGIGGYCSTEEPCQTKNSHCTAENVCQCDENYLVVDKDCKAGVGMQCDTDTDCGMEQSFCKTIEITEGTTSNETEEIKHCHCNEGYVPAKGQCSKKASQYGDECNDDEQCTPLLGDLGTCEQNQCVCNEALQYNNGKCHEKKTLGEKCKTEAECYSSEHKDGMECRNAACRCKFNYTTDVERQVCRPKASKNKSNRPSPLKVITLLLISSATLITAAALKNAYYDTQ